MTNAERISYIICGFAFAEHYESNSLFMVKTFCCRCDKIQSSKTSGNGDESMDMVKIGSFLGKLRKENNMTQEELGEKLGVTNKTISRWETGNYLPPVEMLEALGNMYGLTINEILSGKKLTAEEYKEVAETNIKKALESSAFNLKDKIDFFKKKWLKEHIFIMVLIGIVIAAVFAAGLIFREKLVASVSIPMLVLAHGWRNNTMMAYVEGHVYNVPKEK